MRMWMVNPKMMCNKHLLGEHCECHMFVGSINKGKNINGYVDKNCLEFNSLHIRHDELAKEMELRGMQHKSLLPKVDIVVNQKIKLSTVNKQESLNQLLCRCKKCGVN